MKVVIIDNYDSFTYNLSHLIKELGAEVTVLRNDQFKLEELEPFNKIVLSPGPGIPSEAGLLLDVIRTYAGKKPILGVCLGGSFKRGFSRLFRDYCRDRRTGHGPSSQDPQCERHPVPSGECTHPRWQENDTKLVVFIMNNE